MFLLNVKMSHAATPLKAEPLDMSYTRHSIHSFI